jgi:hypothetical protein
MNTKNVVMNTEATGPNPKGFTISFLPHVVSTFTFYYDIFHLFWDALHLVHLVLYLQPSRTIIRISLDK